MANAKNKYLITKRKQAGCYFFLHSGDEAVSRRIFIGLGDEHGKAIKAIRWVRKQPTLKLKHE
jgi:hypothetical protein